jgi:YbbR domain-containing protein
MSTVIRYLREFASRNLAAKMLSLLLACLVWYSTNAVERDAERVVAVPLALRQVPRNLVVTDWPRERIQVTVRGPRPLLDGIDERRARLLMRLTALDQGENWLDLKAAVLEPEVPRRLKVVRLEPGRVLVQAERLKRRSLPVRATVAGTPTFGFRTAGITVAPERVEVSGPAQEIGELTELHTVPVDIGKQQSTVQRRALIEWVGDFVTFLPDRVLVTVEIEEVMVTREFPDVAVHVLGPEGARLEPATISLTLRGPQRVLHEYRLPPQAAHVSAVGMSPGEHQVDVLVDVPGTVEVITREPNVHRLLLPEGVTP